MEWSTLTLHGQLQLMLPWKQNVEHPSCMGRLYLPSYKRLEASEEPIPRGLPISPLFGVRGPIAPWHWEMKEKKR